MKTKPITLILTLLVALGAIPATSTPTQAAPTVWGCSVQTDERGHGFSSLCTSGARVTMHRARARMYFDSGYSDERTSPWRHKGYFSSYYYQYAVVMNGPWVETW